MLVPEEIEPVLNRPPSLDLAATLVSGRLLDITAHTLKENTRAFRK